jgi:hypothetical protein
MHRLRVLHLLLHLLLLHLLPLHHLHLLLHPPAAADVCICC